MNRDEAILRELNLYPLWVRRAMPAAPVESEPAAVPPEVAVSVVVNDAVLEVASNHTVAAVGRDSSRQSNEENQQAVGMNPDPPNRSDAIAITPARLDWTQLKQSVAECQQCKLRAGCHQTVLGVGDEQADWLFVGEGPGADEDAQGEPFVGQAGKLLDNMLMAIKLKRGKHVYIANVVKCRPPDNRTPSTEEVAHCLPYLHNQIALIRPKLIVALGKTAATALLGKDATLASLRGTLHDYQGIPLIVTYHPAYLLRSPNEKAKAWQDLCFAVQTMQGT